MELTSLPNMKKIKKRSFSDLNASKKKQNKTKAKPHLKQNHNFYQLNIHFVHKSHS